MNREELVKRIKGAAKDNKKIMLIQQDGFCNVKSEDWVRVIKLLISYNQAAGEYKALSDVLRWMGESED